MDAEGTIESLADFLSLLERLDLQEETLFRGQRQDFPLLPKIARKNLRLKKTVLVAEQELIQSFKRQAIIHATARNTRSTLDWLAVAQHHGLPTRLLDWTKNPLAALWFAVKAEPNNSDFGVLWIYQPSPEDFLPVIDESSRFNKLTPFSIKKTQIYFPNHSNQRIVTQSGVFTVHAYIENYGCFVPFEDNVSEGGELKKFEIPAKAFCNLRFDLDRCGINSASIFPDLDGLATHLQWLHGLLEDEIEAHQQALDGNKRS